MSLMIRNTFKDHYMDYSDAIERDICDALITAKNEALREGKEWAPYLTDDNLAMSAMTLFLGGINTSQNTFQWIVLLMCYYPEVQRKLRQEIETQIGDRMPTHEDRNRCHYGERNRPPEPPRIYGRDIPSDAKLTFVDFVPSVTHRDKRDKIFYHPFRILLEVANKWLQHNYDWEVVNCESVTLLFRHNACSHVSQWDLMPNVAASQVMGQEAAIKALRVWMRKREDMLQTKKEDVQVLGYRDFVPDRKEGNKIETLDEVINRVNAIIRDGKFEGRIVSIECLPCESTGDLRFDPEATLPGSSDTTVTVVRIYYEEGPSSEEEIGIADFVPLHLSGGSLFSRPEFETFDTVMSRASRWLSENPEINFRSALSIDFKLKSSQSSYQSLYPII
ncbi:unnamed protein product [Oppiella nova]|uniref:Cytochrome P450 n=1 Tax=Oppiella nova TaxID=334625 RepID=A0A7R9QG43_9ACAR|nr:unnamed protein product [Oppiella nova]CAG2165157.1 unnamed protein product [Oppiella nova]